MEVIPTVYVTLIRVSHVRAGSHTNTSEIVRTSFDQTDYIYPEELDNILCRPWTFGAWSMGPDGVPVGKP